MANKHATRGTVWHNLKDYLAIKNIAVNNVNDIWWLWRHNPHCSFMDMITKKGCDCRDHCAMCPHKDFKNEFLWLFSSNCYEYLYDIVK